MTKTIQEVVETIIHTVPGAPEAGTVDTFKAGDPSQPVTGIVTTFLGTCQVLRRAANVGANLVITHEPVFYNHLDETDWLVQDPVYQSKCQLIQEHGLVIWRFHDYWHRHQPDGILTGVTRALGWEDWAVTGQRGLYAVPSLSLAELVRRIKDSLGIPMVRVVGDPAMICHRACLMPGAAGGKWQIQALARGDVDVLICGEINEWETCEYVRDALDAGHERALVVLGHAESEEAGMKWLAEWLRPLLPDVPIEHVPAGGPFALM